MCTAVTQSVVVFLSGPPPCPLSCLPHGYFILTPSLVQNVSSHTLHESHYKTKDTTLGPQDPEKRCDWSVADRHTMCVHTQGDRLHNRQGSPNYKQKKRKERESERERTRSKEVWSNLSLFLFEIAFLCPNASSLKALFNHTHAHTTIFIRKNECAHALWK